MTPLYEYAHASRLVDDDTVTEYLAELARIAVPCIVMHDDGTVTVDWIPEGATDG